MNLSQDEINAMLAGLSANTEDISQENESPAENDIDAGSDQIPDEYKLTPYEIDTLGEVGNMCMGAVATTMYMLLDRRVSITTPRVSIHVTRDVLAVYEVPFVIVEVQYTEGIQGKNLLLLKEPDAVLITDLLMGGDGKIEEPVEINEMHMSAISEIMNQMIGASATALSQLIHTQVNISPPKSDRVSVHADVSELLDWSQVIVKVSFDMEIEGLLKSQLIQLMPFQLARDLAKRLMEVYTDDEAQEVSDPAVFPAPDTAAAPVSKQTADTAAQDTYPASSSKQPGFDNIASYAKPEPAPPAPGNLVDVRPMQYESFDTGRAKSAAQQGLDIVFDIPLQVSVELGKTKKEISEILEFGMGTVIVLDKVAGDPVEILANGKLIARGEVVVIDENYGVRITELLNK
jgi:flagellar motor switch protein FliN/FliY